MTPSQERLAVHGGEPVRTELLPYGRQQIDADDIEAVTDILRSPWLTTGPAVEAFERAFAEQVGVREAIAVSNGTAALHAAMHAIGIGPGDEVVVPAMTFAATANCVLYQGGIPKFCDVDPDTLLLDPRRVEASITPRTRAILTVDFAGHPSDFDALRTIATRHQLALVDDACHALGALSGPQHVASLADLTAFSFHPVKHVTTGEGGMVTTDDERLAERVRRFRNHGISVDFRQRAVEGSWFYEVIDLGYNYRLTDMQCALGSSQLRKLSRWLTARQEVAAQYDRAFAGDPMVRPLRVRPGVVHAYHLYVVRLDLSRLRATRIEIFRALRAEGIGVNVHYIPVHVHPYYRDRLGTGPGLCPVAEAAYQEILSLPIFPQMSTQDAEDVITAMRKVLRHYAASDAPERVPTLPLTDGAGPA